MTEDMNRRDALRATAIAALVAATGIPATAAAAEVEKLAAPKPRGLIPLEAVRDEIKAYVESYSPDKIKLGLHGAYASLFRHEPVIMRIAHGGEIPQVGLGYATTRQSIHDNEYMTQTKEMVPQLIDTFRMARDYHAADIFNNPYTGTSDRKPLLSIDTGNAFEVPRDLTEASYKEAVQRITNAGHTPRALVVPSDLKDAAAGLTGNVLVWGSLTNRQAWFIRTEVDGLHWSERIPYEMDVWADHVTDNILIKGYERRAFQMSNQWSVFGSAPAAPYCEQARKFDVSKQEGNSVRIVGLAALKNGNYLV